MVVKGEDATHTNTATITNCIFDNDGTDEIYGNGVNLTLNIDPCYVSGGAAAVTDEDTLTNALTADPLLTAEGKLQVGSPAKNTGTIIAGVNDTGQLDPYGNATNATPNIGADQTSDQNLYREDAGFAYNEASYTVRVKKILPTA